MIYTWKLVDDVHNILKYTADVSHNGNYALDKSSRFVELNKLSLSIFLCFLKEQQHVYLLQTR